LLATISKSTYTLSDDALGDCADRAAQWKREAHHVYSKSHGAMPTAAVRESGLRYTADASGVNRTWDPESQADQLGYEPADLNSEPGFWVSQIERADEECWREGVARALASGASRCQYRVRAKDGNLVRIVDTMVASNRGEGPGILSGTCKLNEALPAFSEEKLLRALPAVAYLYDLGSRSFLDVNQHGLELLNVSLEKLVEMGEEAARANRFRFRFA
jgi:hypothetical protein